MRSTIPIVASATPMIAAGISRTGNRFIKLEVVCEDIKEIIFITKINNLFVPYEIELMDDRIGQMTIKNDDKSIRQKNDSFQLKSNYIRSHPNRGNTKPQEIFYGICNSRIDA
jgi:hypothetical protein